jgi:hypothetical protein
MMTPAAASAAWSNVYAAVRALGDLSATLHIHVERDELDSLAACIGNSVEALGPLESMPGRRACRCGAITIGRVQVAVLASEWLPVRSESGGQP